MFLPHPFNWAVGAIHFLLEFGPQFVAACSSGVKTTVDYQYIHLLTPPCGRLQLSAPHRQQHREAGDGLRRGELRSHLGPQLCGTTSRLVLESNALVSGQFRDPSQKGTHGASSGFRHPTPNMKSLSGARERVGITRRITLCLLGAPSPVHRFARGEGERRLIHQAGQLG